jgi:hypothetical protein
MDDGPRVAGYRRRLAWARGGLVLRSGAHARVGGTFGLSAGRPGVRRAA